MLKWFLSLFKSKVNVIESPKFPLCVCGQPLITKLTSMNILGEEIQLTGSPYCENCTKEYFTKWHTMCDTCQKPIFPGQPVGGGHTDHSYTHLTFTCSPLPGLFCGHWGEGILIPLIPNDKACNHLNWNSIDGNE